MTVVKTKCIDRDCGGRCGFPYVTPVRRVVLRGGKFAVAQALANSGVPFVFVREAGPNTVGDVPLDHIPTLSAFLRDHPEFEGRFARDQEHTG